MQCYFTAAGHKKCCFKVKTKKIHEDSDSNDFPYFLNVQKIFRFKRDGHAGHGDVIFVGCTVANICSNGKCNRLCLKMEKEGNKKY